jgi:hypothetical protein
VTSSGLLGPTGQPLRIGRKKPLRLSEIEKAVQRGMTTTTRKVGEGQAAFALTTTVDVQPFRWDTNQFYERLGLDPSCPRIDIVRAYHESPRSTADEHLHYATAAKALLKKAKRALYDRILLGSFYGDDPALDKRRTTPDEEQLAAPDTGWAYYADGTVSDDDVAAYDFEPARTLLTSALAPWARTQEHTPYVALGLTRDATRWIQVGYFPVLMLGVDDQVTEAYALHVADLLAANS